MSWTFRRRIKVLPWVHLNLSKSGISTNIGPRGFNFNIGAKGVSSTIGLPGTGLYSRNKMNISKRDTNDIPSCEDGSVWGVISASFGCIGAILLILLNILYCVSFVVVPIVIVGIMEKNPQLALYIGMGYVLLVMLVVLIKTFLNIRDYNIEKFESLKKRCLISWCVTILPLTYCVLYGVYYNEWTIFNNKISEIIVGVFAIIGLIFIVCGIIELYKLFIWMIGFLIIRIKETLTTGILKKDKIKPSNNVGATFVHKAFKECWGKVVKIKEPLNSNILKIQDIQTKLLQDEDFLKELDKNVNMNYSDNIDKNRRYKLKYVIVTDIIQCYNALKVKYRPLVLNSSATMFLTYFIAKIMYPSKEVNTYEDYVAYYEKLCEFMAKIYDKEFKQKDWTSFRLNIICKRLELQSQYNYIMIELAKYLANIDGFISDNEEVYLKALTQQHKDGDYIKHPQPKWLTQKEQNLIAVAQYVYNHGACADYYIGNDLDMTPSEVNEAITALIKANICSINENGMNISNLETYDDLVKFSNSVMYK